MPHKKVMITEEMYTKGYNEYHMPGSTNFTIAREMGISIGIFYRHKQNIIEWFRRKDKELNNYGTRVAAKRGPKRTTSKLSEDQWDQIIELAKLGVKIKDIAVQMGIDRSTINYHRKINPIFKYKFEHAKELSNHEVEKALHARAKGTKLITKVITITKDQKGKELYRTETETTKEIAPSVNASKFWLTNKSDWKSDGQGGGENNKGAILNEIEKAIEED